MFIVMNDFLLNFCRATKLSLSLQFSTDITMKNIKTNITELKILYIKAIDIIKTITVEIRVNTYKIKTSSKEIKIVPLTQTGRG